MPFDKEHDGFMGLSQFQHFKKSLVIYYGVNLAPLKNPRGFFQLMPKSGNTLCEQPQVTFKEAINTQLMAQVKKHLL